MFYKQTQPQELTRTEMDAARKAFRGKLLRLRYSPQFILNNSDELLAIAHSEYVRAVKKGVEIEDPVGWTIHCAWRRTQNLLQAESVRPRTVSSDQVAELVDDGEPDLEERVLDEDRARKVREAVAKLDADQRQVIALTFFEDMSVREAARHLGCSASSVQHRRETALRSLRRFLPVRAGDELAVDIGMACWLSFAAERSGVHLPAGFEAVIDRAGHDASGLWGRAQDLARRLTVGGGGETATAVASSGAGRAAGVCATGLAVVCLAGAGSGIVGPGIGAIGGGGSSAPVQAGPPRQVAPTPRQASAGASEPTTLETAAADRSTAPVVPSEAASRRSRVKQGRSPTRTTKPGHVSQHRQEAVQVEEEASGIARASAEAPAAPSAETGSGATASASTAGSTGPPTVVDVGKSPTSPASQAAADDQFNFEE